MNSKISKILSAPKTFEIKGLEVKIYPFDFEDSLKLMSLKRNGEEIDMTDKSTSELIKNLMIKKMRQSLTEVKDNSEKLVPTDEEISQVPFEFYKEYMEKLFGMLKSDNEVTRKN